MQESCNCGSMYIYYLSSRVFFRKYFETVYLHEKLSYLTHASFIVFSLPYSKLTVLHRLCQGIFYNTPKGYVVIRRVEYLMQHRSHRIAFSTRDYLLNFLYCYFPSGPIVEFVASPPVVWEFGVKMCFEVFLPALADFFCV